jgi:hypothetical protein
MSMRSELGVKVLRLLLVIWIIATIHFTTMLALGVFGFLTQGSFDKPGPPSVAHRVISAAATVLEFPFVWAVRRHSPERHEGFTSAAIATSLLWGVVLYLGWALWPRSAQARA